MCSQDFDRVNGSDEPSVLASAYFDLGARKRDARIFFGVLAPCADSVYLVGSFNGWCETHELSQNRFGIWQTSLSSDEISDGDRYKFKVYSCGSAVYLTDPYSFETDGEPYFNSVYREQPSDDEAMLCDGRASACFAQPLNIYEIKADGWLRYDDGDAVDFVSLSRELLPYVLQMGYTHVSISGVFEEYCGFDASSPGEVCFALGGKQGGIDALRSFVRLMHSASVGVLMDWRVGKSFGQIEADLAFYTQNALYWIDCFGVDGFVINYSDTHTSEFFKRLVHSVKSERASVSIIVKYSAERGMPFADASVRECGAYSVYFKSAGDHRSRLYLKAAAMSYLLLKEGKMLTRMGYEIGQDCGDCFDRRLLEDGINAAYQLFCSELSHIYLSRSSVWGCGGCRSSLIQTEYGGVRVIRRRSEDSELVLAVDLLGGGGEAFISSRCEWRVLLDSSEMLGGGASAAKKEDRRGIRIGLMPYGAVLLERII